MSGYDSDNPDSLTGSRPVQPSNQSKSGPHKERRRRIETGAPYRVKRARPQIVVIT